MAYQDITLKEVGMIKSIPVEGHAESYLPKEKQWQLVWHDEFDGSTLDESKWNIRRYFWGRTAMNFTDEGIEVSDGTLKLRIVRNGELFSSAQLQTGCVTADQPRDENTQSFWPFGAKQPAKFMHRYGYYEIRCKLPKGAGWHAAFWLQSPSIGMHPNPRYAGVECDIMENYRQHTEGKIICGNGWGGYGKESKWYGHYAFPYEETADGWHHYGVDWSLDGYIFYADGKEVGRQMAPECAVSEVEQFVLITTETHGFLRLFDNAEGAGIPAIHGGVAHPALFDTYPDKFEVDFVRVFDTAE